jgi:hypothetical protein
MDMLKMDPKNSAITVDVNVITLYLRTSKQNGVERGERGRERGKGGKKNINEEKKKD